jgi:agmatine deiminase
MVEEGANRLAAGIRMPAEWEPHDRTIMGWPCRRELWGETLAQAKQDYAAVANAISAFEPVTLLANPGADAAEARGACAATVAIEELPLDDSWLRDCGPIYVDAGNGSRVAVHFRFNAWGGKFPPWDRDAAVGRLVAERLGDEVVEAPIILEGGSILSNGEGTLLTTEQCLLNPNRNPGLTRAEIEGELTRWLGALQVIWLGDGLVEDRDTDGHVDLIAAFAPDRNALLQKVPRSNPNYERCEDNHRRLLEVGINVIELPHLPYVQVAGETVAAGYLNLYVCNGAVLVPVTGVDSDPDAISIIAAAFPGREVVPVPGAVLAYGGGGPHCITQQVPALAPAMQREDSA